jgi:Sec-independent protein translocase protein TatA
MFDIGLSEVLVVGVVAVVLLSPEDLPKLAKFYRHCRKSLRNFTKQATDLLDLGEDHPPAPSTKHILGDDGKWHEAFTLEDFIFEPVASKKPEPKEVADDPTNRES